MLHRRTERQDESCGACRLENCCLREPKRQENEKPWHASRDTHTSPLPQPSSDHQSRSTGRSGSYMQQHDRYQPLHCSCDGRDRPNSTSSYLLLLTSRIDSAGRFATHMSPFPRPNEAALLSHSEWRRKGGTTRASVSGRVGHSYSARCATIIRRRLA